MTTIRDGPVKKYRNKEAMKTPEDYPAAEMSW